MQTSDGTEPIEDDEELYRRIPVSRCWYSQGSLAPQAFEPRKDEDTGISVYRKKYKTIEEAAKSIKGKGPYYVVVLNAGILQQSGIRIEPRPLEEDPGHAELPDLTCHTKETDEAIQKMKTLTKIFSRIEGPFPLQS